MNMKTIFEIYFSNSKHEEYEYCKKKIGLYLQGKIQN